MTKKSHCIGVLLALAAASVDAGSLQGWLAPAAPVAVGAALDGRVAAVKVVPGQTVGDGDVLVELDGSVWVAERDALQARLRQLEGARDEAERERARTQDLFDRTLISEHELNLSRNAYDAAVAEYRHTQAALVEARRRVVWASVAAPFAGTVAEVATYVGQAVSNGCRVQTLVSLVPRDALRVIARADADTRVYPGQTLAVTAGGETLQATVTAVTPEPDGLRIEAGLQSAPGTPVRAGQSVGVTLP